MTFEEALQEIKDTYAKEQGYEDWKELMEELYGNVPELRIEKYMDEICICAQKEALEKASENATMLFDAVYDWHAVNKESIINENNLIR